MIGNGKFYADDQDKWEAEHQKGGKPNPGTPKDGRLKDNQKADGGDAKPPKKPAFPGAAPPFGGKPGKNR